MFFFFVCFVPRVLSILTWGVRAAKLRKSIMIKHNPTSPPPGLRKPSKNYPHQFTARGSCTLVLSANLPQRVDLASACGRVLAGPAQLGLEGPHAGDLGLDVGLEPLR